MNSISEHLAVYGSWRTSHFVELAKHLTGKADILHTAKWCPEMFFAITKDGCESRFFEVWALAAEFMHARGVFSGEGGVIGLAAATVGWEINYTVLERLGRSIQHEGGGPKTI